WPSSPRHPPRARVRRPRSSTPSRCPCCGVPAARRASGAGSAPSTTSGSASCTGSRPSCSSWSAESRPCSSGPSWPSPTARCSRPRRTTRSSRCTARRW
ncbi:MAG: Cytochrome c oxidase polypeptide I, partial [uncultured Acidimicrobiales bacterium]